MSYSILRPWFFWDLRSICKGLARKRSREEIDVKRKEVEHSEDCDPEPIIAV
jgi:hypothetical protein